MRAILFGRFFMRHSLELGWSGRMIRVGEARPCKRRAAASKRQNDLLARK